MLCPVALSAETAFYLSAFRSHHIIADRAVHAASLPVRYVKGVVGSNVDLEISSPLAVHAQSALRYPETTPKTEVVNARENRALVFGLMAHGLQTWHSVHCPVCSPSEL